MEMIMRKRHHGFMAMDAIAAIMIVAALATALAIGMNRQESAMRRLHDQRSAANVAERVLTRLQSGGASQNYEGSKVEVVPMKSPQAPSGYAWVEVRVKTNSSTASLVGLVPAKEANNATAPSK